MELYLKLTKSFSQKYRFNKVLIQKVMNSGSIIILTQKYARVKNNIGAKKMLTQKQIMWQFFSWYASSSLKTICWLYNAMFIVYLCTVASLLINLPMTTPSFTELTGNISVVVIIVEHWVEVKLYSWMHKKCTGTTWMHRSAQERKGTHKNSEDGNRELLQLHFSLMTIR